MKKGKDKPTQAAELRRLAEHRLRQREAEVDPPGTEQDTLRLLHELQVHQIELEMQNQELVQARQELKAGLERYADLYDSAPVGYFTLGRDGTIRQANLTGANLLGVQRGNLANRRFGQFVSPADRPAFSTYLDSVFEGKGQHACEVTIFREGCGSGSGKSSAETSSCHVRIEAQATEDGQACRAVMMDVTARKRADERIESLARFPDENPNPVLRVDARGTILYANGAAEENLLMPWKVRQAQVLPVSLAAQVAASLSSGTPAEMEITVADRTHLLVLTPIAKAGYVNLYARDITDRKRAEDSLRDSEQRFRSLVESAPEAIFVQSQGRVVYINPALLRLLGASRSDELLGTDFMERIAPEHHQAILERIRFQQETGKPAPPMEMEYVQLDGFRVPVETTAVAIQYQGDDAHLVFVRDITERKRAEERHGTVLRTAMDGFWVIDAQGRILEANEAFCQMTGYGREELLKMSIPDLEAVEKPQETAEHIRRIVAAGKARFESRHRRKDGRIIDVEVSLTYMPEPSKVLFSFARDITDRKQAEARLREAQERLALTASATQVGMFDWDLAKGKVLWTATQEAMFGYAPATTTTTTTTEHDPSRWTERIHPDDLTRVEGQLQVSAREHRPFQEQYRIVWPDKSEHCVETKGVFFYADDGEAVRMLGVVTDITANRRLQDQLAQAQKMEAIGQLAGGVAHDFRNQLTVIKGYGEMLLRRELVKESGKEPLSHILKAADRSAAVSAQLLAFSRRQTLRPEVANLNEVTGDMMKALSQTIGEDIRLSVMPCGDLWNTRLDIGQFQQALMNLVLNARDAMPQGGQLTVGTENTVLDEGFVRQHVGASAGRYVVLTVSDTGCGMDAETVGHLFEPFFTTKPVGKGTGLGLAMVHGFVAQSDGFIEVQSAPSQPAGPGTPAVPGGTTFRLYFPAVEDVAESAEGARQATELPQGSGTILMVEDEDAIRRIVSETLGECGYTVLTAGDAQEAMGLIESANQKIDLLITDVVMPGWSGPELAKHFQAARPGIPILMVSGHTGDMLTGHGVIPSDVNMLSKPFCSQTLAETVGKVLGQPNRP